MPNFKLFNVLCAVCLFICSFSIYADGIMATIRLLQLDGIKSSEKMGDELYFSITEYSSSATPKLNRVPMFPIHWTTKELPQIKNVILWSGEIQANDSVLIILTLLEQDLPPWNADDHIGSAQVKLANKNGKLVAQWGQPDFKDQPKVKQIDGSVPKFMMYGENSEYVLVFQATVNK